MLTNHQMETLSVNVDARVAVYMLLTDHGNVRPSRSFAELAANLLEVRTDLKDWVEKNRFELVSLINHLRQTRLEELAADRAQFGRRLAEAREERDLDDILTERRRDPSVDPSDFGAQDVRLQRHSDPTAEEGDRTTLEADLAESSELPTFSDLRFGPIKVAHPLSARRSLVLNPRFYATIPEFVSATTLQPWSIAVIDLEYVPYNRVKRIVDDPFSRLDAVDLLLQLSPTSHDKNIIVTLNDPWQLSTEMRLAEARLKHFGVAGASQKHNEIARAVETVAGDRHYDGNHWAGIKHQRLEDLGQIVKWLEGGRQRDRADARWARHLLVAAAAGIRGPQAFAGALGHSQFTVKGAAGRVCERLSPLLGESSGPRHSTAIAALGSAMSPWLWGWARRNAALFDPGFLDAMRLAAFGPVEEAM